MRRLAKDALFSEIYAVDPANNCTMIEVALDQYSDVFDEWDPAPFKRRSLDPDLELYLESSSEEIPLGDPIELCFNIPAQIQDTNTEAEMRNGLKNSFAFKLYLIKKELKKTNAQILRYIILGFLLLGLGSAFVNQLPSRPERELLMLIADALIIGGWVFLWEAVSLFFFTNREVYHRYKIYQRLHNAPVIFRT